MDHIDFLKKLKINKKNLTLNFCKYISFSLSFPPNHPCIFRLPCLKHLTRPIWHLSVLSAHHSSSPFHSTSLFPRLFRAAVLAPEKHSVSTWRQMRHGGAAAVTSSSVQLCAVSQFAWRCDGCLTRVYRRSGAVNYGS